MADTERPLVVLTGPERMQQELRDAMDEMKNNPLDKTVPGGKYLGTDGQEHDAHGRKLGEVKQAGKGVQDPVARLAELEKERANLQILLQQQQAEAAARAAAGETGAGGEEEEPKKGKGGGKR